MVNDLAKTQKNRMEDLEIRRKRMRYQSWHRGCKETDLILGKFCDRYINEFNAGQLQAFQSILEADDADLYQWLTERKPLPDIMQRNPVMKLLMEFT